MPDTQPPPSPAPPAAERPPLVVFGDDWGRHPSSCQHLVRHLLADCDVTWIDTIGMRPPRCDWQTVTRGWEKMRHWRPGAGRADRDGHAAGSALRVLRPRMWPSFRSRFGRRLNRRCLGRFLQRHVPRLPEATVLSMLPIVADLPESVPARRWVYYCVDDFSVWPGLDSQTLEQMEQKLIAAADAVVAVSEVLCERIRAAGRRPLLLSHGVDLEHWQPPARPAADPPPLAGIVRPRVLFFGLIDRRLDTAWLRMLADRLPRGVILLAGPQQQPDPELETIPRLRMLGPIPYAELPAVAAACDVLIMPYADLPVTRAMQPLKLKEYLAGGKSVVVRNLPAAEEWRDALDIAESPERFARLVADRLQSGLPAAQRAARARLQEESWRAKAVQLREVLFDQETGRPEPAGGPGA